MSKTFEVVLREKSGCAAPMFLLGLAAIAWFVARGDGSTSDPPPEAPGPPSGSEPHSFNVPGVAAPEPPVVTLPPSRPLDEGVRSNSFSSTPSTARPEARLAPEDADFLDTRGGWGWSDRCWKHLHAGRLDHARAACQEGLALNPPSPNPKAPLVYNMGLIEERSGNMSMARKYFSASLSIREHPEVRTALERVSP